jgi:hypothetical protein
MLEYLTQGDPSSTPLWDNPYLIGTFGAALGFLSAFLIEFVKARKSLRSELTWEYDIDAPQQIETAGSQSRLQISYGDTVTEKLTIIRFRVANTGNMLVKDESLRFALPSGARLLEAFLDPAVTPEAAVTVTSTSHTEVTWNIGYLPPNNSVGFNLICDGGEWEGWSSVFDKNEHTLVDFQRKGTERAVDDRIQLRRFLQVGAAWGIALFTATAMPTNLYYPAAFITAPIVLVLGLIMVAYSPGAMRAIASTLTDRSAKTSTTVRSNSEVTNVSIQNQN